MKTYLKKAKALTDSFTQFEINVVPIEENADVDSLRK